MGVLKMVKSDKQSPVLWGKKIHWTYLYRGLQFPSCRLLSCTAHSFCKNVNRWLKEKGALEERENLATAWSVN